LQIETGENPWEGKPSLGFAKNVRNRGWVLSFNHVSSERIYLLLPIFATQILGADVSFSVQWEELLRVLQVYGNSFRMAAGLVAEKEQP